MECNKYGQLDALIQQHMIRDSPSAPAAAGLDFAGGDLVFPKDFGTLHHTPSTSFQLGFYPFGAG